MACLAETTSPLELFILADIADSLQNDYEPEIRNRKVCSRPCEREDLTDV